MSTFQEAAQNYLSQLGETWNQSLKKLRISAVIIGAVLILLGILCLVYPVESIYAMEVVASIGILSFGIVEIAAYFSAPIYLRNGGTIIGGILNIVIGILLLGSPMEDLLNTFAWIFALNLVVIGINELTLARKLKLFGLENGNWFIGNGILNILAALVFFFLPGTSSAALSIFVGVYLLVGGISLIVDSIQAKYLKANTATNNTDDTPIIDVKEEDITDVSDANS